VGPVLQPDSLKLGSCKFNFIINIINITLRSGVAAKPKIIGYNFAEKLKIFIFLFVLICFMQKKNDPQHRAGIKASIIQRTSKSQVTF
jgi:hypothetical protein